MVPAWRTMGQGIGRSVKVGIMADHFDIVIAGGGAAGLALALALRQAAGDALSVAVCDPELARDGRGDSRAYAIVTGAIRFFEGVGAWRAMADAAEPMRAMEITDSSLEELVRPLMLEFDARAAAGEPFAQMLPNAVILAALSDRARELGVPMRHHGVERFRCEGSRIALETADGPISARLLVAADGRGSRLRQQAGIPYYGWAYPQTAIVGTITHSLPHEGVAVQHFLPSGPFAMLPLKGGLQSSIVWSERPDIARDLLAGDVDDLLRAVDQRAAGRFGVVRDIAGVQAFPLSLGVARRFVGPRLALLGDAAHGMHPLAGQGLNYGLRGAAALAETILDAARIGLDIGSDAALAPYEAGRRPDVMAIALATESLNRLFSTNLGPVRAIRDIGLGLFNRLPGLKERAMREAQGAGRWAPRAFRGEPA